MIGDRDLRITPRLELDAVADRHHLERRRRLKLAASSSDESTPIEDDHLPFLEAGVPSVDIIDLDYPRSGRGVAHRAGHARRRQRPIARSCRRRSLLSAPRRRIDEDTIATVDRWPTQCRSAWLSSVLEDLFFRSAPTLDAFARANIAIDLRVASTGQPALLQPEDHVRPP